ncbi:hypothetical protein EST38_g4803 [Candolleomyces aberdarensis]|uniref:Uncharacterized protein n=1 Tax=Candolleomyces aberdarensis TaxID=2316362 RepID=A0A4Q2DNY8_9AGAR|nr:hypothetical protein EST38_g4803 [Candolleomyces aberdarensis]
MSPTRTWDEGEPGPQTTGVFDICSLPNEILALILESVHKQGHRWGTVRGRATEEIVISHVCSLWRDTALATPELWTKYRCVKPSPQQFAMEYERLQTYLTRSGTDTDLDLVFDFVDVPVTVKDPSVMDMLNLVVPNLYRLRRFVLLSDGVNYVTPFHQALTGASAPRLEHFEVLTGQYHNINEEGYDGQPHWDPKILTEGSPNIKFLKLDSPAMGRFRPPFNNLVHFSLEAGIPRLRLLLLWVCLEQVLSLPFIETFSLWDVVIANPNPGHLLRRIKAKHLKHVRFGRRPPSLHIRFGRWPCYPLFFFLHYVSAPLLETITISSVTLSTPHTPAFPLVPGEADLSYIFPNLKSLFLNNIMSSDPAQDQVAESRTIKRLLSATATIALLCISTTVEMPGDGVLKALQVDPDLQRFQSWPQLRELTLSIPDQAASTDLIQFCMDYWSQLSIIRLPSLALDFVPTSWKVPVEESAHKRDPKPRSFWADFKNRFRSPGASGKGPNGKQVCIEEIQDVFPMYWPPGYMRSSGIDTGNLDSVHKGRSC